MDFLEQMQDLSARSEKLKGHLQTEEATKTSLVLPFIKTLGYDIFNPQEVIPEYIADHGIKKGEKVDYAILLDGKPIMLFECKMCGADLEKAPCSQLYRYFSVTDARIGVLTDGMRYLFFTDLDEPNKMDARPFMEIDLADLDESLLPELKKLAKGRFDINATMSAATELKYTREIKKALSLDFANPSDELIKYYAAKVYAGRLTPAVREQFSDIVRKALLGFIDDRISERLKSALTQSDLPKTSQTEEAQAEPQEEKKIDTTPEEVEGFYIVKSILREVCDPARVFYRDAQSYFSVILDNSNRKPICRLYLGPSRKLIGLFDENKKEEKVGISDLNEVFQHAEKLKRTALAYIGKQEAA